MPNNTRKQTHSPEVAEGDEEKRSTDAQKQVYDNVIKRLIEGQYEDIFDPLLEEDPWVQEYGAQREAKGEAKGEARGKIQSMRQNIETIIQLRFPDLREPVMNYVDRMKEPMSLQHLLIVLATMKDDEQARSYLKSLYTH